MIEKRELTPDEMKKSYAKYYYQEMAPVPKEIMKILDKGPIDSAKALPAARRNDLLNPGYLEGEIGYCEMFDGSGYLAILTKMPGVTAEMFDWWFVWHPLEDLRYAIWAPGIHISAFLSVKDREKHLNPAIPIRERNWGSRHCIIEGDPDFFPISELEANFMSPEDFGFDMTRFKSPNVATVVCSNAGPRRAPQDTMMCHFLREIEDGCELRTRFWFGKAVKEKKVVDLPMQVPAEVIAKGMAYHNAIEFHNLAAILPQVYKEQKGKVTL